MCPEGLCRNAWRSPHGSVTYGQVCSNKQGEASLFFLFVAFCSIRWLAPGVLHLRTVLGLARVELERMGRAAGRGATRGHVSFYQTWGLGPMFLQIVLTL